MGEILYRNHETGDIYLDEELAMDMYQLGYRIDVMWWSNISNEYVIRNHWEP